MRALFYDVVGLLLYGAGFVFLLRAVRFLTAHDYVAAVVCGVIGLLVIRVGSELAKLSLLSAWRSRETDEK